MKPIFYSVIFRIHSPAGHTYSYHRALNHALAQLSISHFSYYVGKITTLDVLPSGWSNLFKGIRACLRSTSAAPRIFFIESFTSKEFLRLILASFLFLKKQDALWILLRYGKHQLPLQGKGHFFFIRMLQWRFGNRFLPLTDSEIIAEEFQHKLSVLPIPHTVICPPTRKSQICWWPGAVRQEKGFADIQRLARSQDPKAKEFPLALSQAAQIPCTYPLPAVLSIEEYHNWLTKSRVILLPYDPHVYKSGTSGVFVEAVVAGKMPLVKEGSWLAQELRKFDLTELIVDWEDPLFFSHLFEKLNDKNIKHKLTSMQKTYVNYHSLKGYTHALEQLLRKTVH